MTDPLRAASRDNAPPPPPPNPRSRLTARPPVTTRRPPRPDANLADRVFGLIPHPRKSHAHRKTRSGIAPAQAGGSQ